MIPVIFIHKGMQEYLKYTLKQANKENEVYLLGDNSPSIEGIKFQEIRDLWDGCDDFTNHYSHLNTTPLEYEKFCYHRWFILRNFMVKNNINVVFYCDSDVMLFTDVTKEWEKYNQYGMTLIHRTAAVSSFITLKTLEDFCNLLINTYKNKHSYNYKKIASHFQVRNSCGLPGGVCDMTFLDFFHYCSDCGGGPGLIGEMMTVIDDSTYDHNINVADHGFAFKNGKKDFTIKNGKPFIFNKRLGKEIKFNSLHFQGGAKNEIKRTYERCE